ncbi:DNA polymerase III subunit beta [Candidatus Gottesmanbacteria bacterium]|nr:DNA polymerase III subunit beta [Candidatus Gottesmanbacteria bacterium]
MHFLVLKENIQKILTIAGRNISNRPQLPILSNILLKTENGKLTLAVTNLEIGVIFTIPAKIEKEGETTIPGKLLTEFVSLLSAEKIEFLLEGTNLRVLTNKTKASFSTTPPADFPPFPKPPEIKNMFSFTKIKDALTHTVFAASLDEGRPVLTGVKTVVSNGKLTLSATDGYRLSMENVDIPDKKEEFTLILPSQTLTEVMRIAADLKVEDVGFSIIENKNQAVFTFPQVHVFTRLIDGEFPNVEKIIPTMFKTKVTVGREELLQSVKTASLFARSAANIVKVKVEKEGLRLSAVTPQIGEDEDFIETKVEGEEGEIAFNYRFLMDLLNNFPEEEVVFEMSGPLNPGVFKPASGKSPFLHIIMPVRIQS